MKAHGVDTANQTTAELALLLGATGYRADSPIAKTLRDLNGLERLIGLNRTTRDLPIRLVRGLD